MKRNILFCLVLLFTIHWSQTEAQKAEAPNDWFHLDLNQDKYPGVSANRMYEELLKGKKGQKVIVAVLGFRRRL